MRGRKDLGNKALGAYGEARVAAWYQAHGYTIIARNWRCRDGEIDLIVALTNTVVVFCEVKTRRSDAFGSPAEAVGWQKQRRLRRLAAIWLQQSAMHPQQIRFDVAGVIGSRVTIIEAAF